MQVLKVRKERPNAKFFPDSASSFCQGPAYVIFPPRNRIFLVNQNIIISVTIIMVAVFLSFQSFQVNLTWDWIELYKTEISKLVNLLTPLSLFGDKRNIHSLFVGKFSRLLLKTCCEKNKCKILSQIAIFPRKGQRN